MLDKYSHVSSSRAMRRERHYPLFGEACPERSRRRGKGRFSHYDGPPHSYGDQELTLRIGIV